MNQSRQLKGMSLNWLPWAAAHVLHNRSCVWNGSCEGRWPEVWSTSDTLMPKCNLISIPKFSLEVMVSYCLISSFSYNTDYSTYRFCFLLWTPVFSFYCPSGAVGPPCLDERPRRLFWFHFLSSTMVSVFWSSQPKTLVCWCTCFWTEWAWRFGSFEVNPWTLVVVVEQEWQELLHSFLFSWIWHFYAGSQKFDQ